MKLTRFSLLLVFGIAILTMSGCKKDSVTNPFDNISLTENAPTVANSTNSFAFAINGNDYTKNYEYILNMNTQNLGIAITITNRTRGSVAIYLFSETNAKVFSRELSSNTASSETFTFDSRVNRIQIQFTNFTASLNCAVSTK